MVFYFKARPEVGDYSIFMGLDKYENEELIKYGFPEDIWYDLPLISFSACDFADELIVLTGL